MAVDYYLNHGKCVRRTCIKLGYPSRPELDSWIAELAQDYKRPCRASGTTIKCTKAQKEEAVIARCSKTKTAREIASEYGTTRENLYNWKRVILGSGEIPQMKTCKSSQNADKVFAENAKLIKEKETLQQEIYRLQLDFHEAVKWFERHYLIKKGIHNERACEKSI